MSAVAVEAGMDNALANNSGMLMLLDSRQMSTSLADLYA